MNAFFVAFLLLQSTLPLPPRTGMENPAAVSKIPPKIQKDYDKLWARFVAGKTDSQLTKDLDNRLNDAEQLYKQALTILPDDPTLHLRLAELLGKENKAADAAAQRKIAEDLAPRRNPETARNDSGPKRDDLEDLGRWGRDINV